MKTLTRCLTALALAASALLGWTPPYADLQGLPAAAPV